MFLPEDVRFNGHSLLFLTSVIAGMRIELIEVNTVDAMMLGLPAYFLFALIASGTGSICILTLFAVRRMVLKKSLIRCAIAAPFLLIGARLWGLLYRLFELLLLGEKVTLEEILNSGIVFYGGLTGYVLAYVFLWRKDEHLERADAYDSLAVTIPLFHAIARCGCFFAGCCYGKESNGWLSLLYTNDVTGQIVTASRIPIQLLESGFNFALFILLLILFIKRKLVGNLLWLYMVLYPVWRFFIEFWRGDWNRYAFRTFSPSQYYSLIIISVVIIVAINKQKRKRR